MTQTTEPDYSGDNSLPVDELRQPIIEEANPRSSAARVALLTVGVIALGFWTGRSMMVMIGALVVIIFLHELGHYIAAKVGGMKVTQFFLGFGPTLWSFQRGETEYGLKAIPAGAYVKIIGMHNLDEVDPAEEHRTYRQKSFPRRLAVAVAGSTAHFLIALVLIFTVLVGWGAPGSRLLDQVDVAPEDWVVGAVVDGSAADLGGLEPGDKVVRIGTGPVETFADLADIVGPNPGKTFDVVVLRDGDRVTLPLTLGTNEAGDRGFLGIERRYPALDLKRLGAAEAVPAAFADFGSITVETIKGVGTVLSPSGLSNYVSIVFDNEAQTATGGGGAPAADSSSGDEGRLVSIVGASRFGASALDQGIDSFLIFLVTLNVFIGVFNLLPMLPLDGGHVAIAAYERVREIGRGGRRYFADVSRLLPFTYAVVIMLIFIGVTSIYLDIARPITP